MQKLLGTVRFFIGACPQADTHRKIVTEWPRWWIARVLGKQVKDYNPTEKYRLYLANTRPFCQSITTSEAHKFFTRAALGQQNHSHWSLALFQRQRKYCLWPIFSRVSVLDGRVLSRTQSIKRKLFHGYTFEYYSQNNESKIHDLWSEDWRN